MQKLILIVEDEQAIADSIAYALRTDGFVSRHVTLGGQALATMRAGGAAAPDLVVLDVGLPDMNGFEVCRQLRQFCNVPVIFLTARSDEIDRIVGLEIGADDYVIKPFSPRELVARIRTVLRRLAPTPLAGAGLSLLPAVRVAMTPPVASDSSAPNSMAPRAGPAVFASAAFPAPVVQDVASPARPAASTSFTGRFELRVLEARILFCGQALELTRYEYLLLKTLLERPAHVLSRAQLMDQVWTDAPDTLERTVDAHIKALRAKLRQVDASCEPIHTHRGMGYSIERA